mmetsp:Transcript_59599/g.82754  ORF Transcript_59599/g.82754 Transcript_59599/m.82754 type:complete len:240 (-) Transcript_59599:8-727(-)
MLTFPSVPTVCRLINAVRLISSSAVHQSFCASVTSVALHSQLYESITLQTSSVQSQYTNLSKAYGEAPLQSASLVHANSSTHFLAALSYHNSPKQAWLLSAAASASSDHICTSLPWLQTSTSSSQPQVGTSAVKRPQLESFFLQSLSATSSTGGWSLHFLSFASVMSHHKFQAQGLDAVATSPSHSSPTLPPAAHLPSLLQILELHSNVTVPAPRMFVQSSSSSFCFVHFPVRGIGNTQ